MTRKILIAALGAAMAVSAGLNFHRSRHLAEPVVVGPGVTRVAKLGDYFGPVRGTVNDANVYILEGREPGGTVLLLGGTHPEEPAGRLAAWIFAEAASIARGRLMIIPTANRSASTATRLGGDADRAGGPRSHRQPDEVVERGTLTRVGEVSRDQNTAELFAERRVVQADKEVGVELGKGRPSAVGGGLPSFIERSPESVAVEVEERQTNVGSLRTASGDYGPIGKKAEGEFAGKG